MANANRASDPLDIVTACRAADVGVLSLTREYLLRFVPFGSLHVFTAERNFPEFRRKLGPDVILIDQDQAIPGVTLSRLRKLALPGFPQGAGWYFQQLLKLSFCFLRPDNDSYLIWDADTIPLRPIEFFDGDGRMLFTTADEEHAPYFDTYRRLLHEEPNREFSFISQHMIVRKSIAREMLANIESNLPGNDSWAWKIMRNLEGSSTNLFSEYEMLGHFVKNHHGSQARYRKLSWLRRGASETKGMPSASDLKRLANQYAFVAFESSDMPLRKFIRGVRAWLRRR